MQSEEGEITDDSDNGIDPYTPLERPSLDRPQLPPPLPQSYSPPPIDDPITTSSDSDSDDAVSGKRRRMTSVSRPPVSQTLHRQSQSTVNKYAIWSDASLTDVLTSFDMETRGLDRNVENYPLPKEVEERFKTDESQFRPKDRRFDQKDNFGRKGAKGERRRKIAKGRHQLDPLHPDSDAKQLPVLTVTESNSFEEVAKDIAEKLEEPNAELILRIVIILGKDKAIEVYDRTRKIENDGGMLVLSGTRKRTSGGIFIFLVRTDDGISSSQLAEMFEEPVAKKVKRLRRRPKKAVKGAEKEESQLSNPPPSPDTDNHLNNDLPPLPALRDLITYEDMF